MTDADGSCLCAQERLCGMWLWDCRGSHQHFEKHVAWLLSTNWDVTLGGSKPCFGWKNPDLWGHGSNLTSSAFAYVFSNLVGWKESAPTKQLNCGSSTCDQRVSFRPFFFQMCQQFALMVSLIGLMMSCSCSGKISKRSIFPSQTKNQKNQSARPIQRRSFCIILLEPLFSTKKACDARLSITSCPFKQFLTMRGWRAMRGMAMLCFPVDLTSWFHSRSWVNSMVNWLLVQKCLFFFFWSGENWKVVTGGFGWRPKWLK